MPKIATRYLEVDPWKIIERGFNKERGVVSESIFSLANEYMGTRGNFEEGYSGKTLIGNYFNGIYEVPEKNDNPQYKGISNKNHFMVNSLNWAFVQIYIDDILVDLNKCEFEDFIRELDLKTGLLTRSYIYKENGSEVKITFEKILGFVDYHNASSKIKIQPLNKKINLKVTSGIDYDILHFGQANFWDIDEHEEKELSGIIIGQTKRTKQKILTKYQFKVNTDNYKTIVNRKFIGRSFELNLSKNDFFEIEKNIANFKQIEPISNLELIKNNPINLKTFDEIFISNKEYLKKVWDTCDIKINGDDINQQGIRYSIFSLLSTYQGLHLNNNIGAKGLTGEAYSGHAFWDTETYCLPFYLFNNQAAAKDLLLFRYKTLENAKKRAKELDCEGACFPIATLNGDEACSLWQHASLQFQPTSGVAYGIYHYVNVTKDNEFLKEYGLEMLIEISRFFASRGDFNHDKTSYGYYGVMGPDEFQMMVNHNTYTNYLAKKSIDYTLEILEKIKKEDKIWFDKIIDKTNLKETEIEFFKLISSKMKILYDEKTKLYEQHDGFFDLPHVEVNKIPVEDFPLYSHWSYDRIYRNDMIKQPDVLMMMLLYNQSFTKEQKLANYEFYEPKTIHESSLSPSVHSILALELGKIEEGLDFFGFATRMDLDDYNRNTFEGLHLTSISAAWLNIVYGFGGLRSDGELLKIAPILPSTWDSYEFKINYLNSKIRVSVSKEKIEIYSTEEITIKVYDNVVTFKGTYNA